MDDKKSIFCCFYFTLLHKRDHANGPPTNHHLATLRTPAWYQAVQHTVSQILSKKPQFQFQICHLLFYLLMS